MNRIPTSYISTVPIEQMENEIIKINQKGFVVIKSQIIDGNIKLFAVKRVDFLKRVDL